MPGATPVVFPENWQTYTYRTEDGPVFATFYAGADAIGREAFPFCARVRIPIQQRNEKGGPSNDEAEVLWNLEDELTSALTQAGTSCVLLGRLTHAGVRELVFQLADWESFRPPVGRWMKQSTHYEIDVSEHDGWSFFDRFLWPTTEDWILINDRRVVTGLIEAGSDPAAEHSLEYVFTGDQAKLEELKAKLAAEGYEELDSSARTDQLVMAKRLPLELSKICTESLKNRRLCDDLEVEFDGWGAAVMK